MPQKFKTILNRVKQSAQLDLIKNVYKFYVSDYRSHKNMVTKHSTI